MSATQVPFALPVIVRNDGVCVRSLVDADGNIIALNSMVSKFSPAEDRDNLESIADCINNHAALVEALKKISAIRNNPNGSDWEEIEAAREIATEALRKAGEGK